MQNAHPKKGNAAQTRLRANIVSSDGADQSTRAKPCSVLHQIHLFAARMRGESGAQLASITDKDTDKGALSREVLSARAGEMGLAIGFEMRELAKLTTRDFPCILLLNDAQSWLATGFQNDEMLLVETVDGIKTLDLATVKPHYAGIALKLSPLETGAAALPETANTQTDSSSPEPASTGKRQLISDIIDHILAHNRGTLMRLALAAGLSNLLLVVLPLFIMAVYDRIIPHLAMETLWALAIGVIVALLIDLGLRNARASLLDSIAIQTGNHFQARFYNRLMRLQLTQTPRTAGQLASALQEFETLCRMVPQIAIAMMIDLPFFLLLMGLLYFMAGTVVIAPVLGIIVIAMVHMITYARAREPASAGAHLSHKRANQMVETIAAMETVKTSGAENQLLASWERRLDSGNYLSHLARQQNELATQTTLVGVQLTIVLTLIIGVYELQAGHVTMGALAASSLLVGRAMGPMGGLIALTVAGSHLLRRTGSIEQINSAALEQAGDHRSGQITDFAGELAFSKVGFAYEGSAKKVLQDIDLHITPGERVGLIGRIGCGKSSLLKMLPRLIEPVSGALSLDHHDIRQFDPAFLRRQMALMPQEAVLVEGSLRDNIGFGLDHFEQADFEQAVELAGVRDFAARHPEGYSAPVGPRGERLSGGERASVVLARTLLRNPAMLLLDEPTAAMDNELERRIVQNLAGWLGKRTLVLATHRAPVLALVERVIWLHEGRIIADGPRDDVLAKLKG